jgi:hypothetical protein
VGEVRERTLFEGLHEWDLRTRFFLLGGPAGLLVALLVGLWAARLHVDHYVVVHTDSTWQPGGTAVVRSQVRDGAGDGVRDVLVSARLRAGGEEHELGALDPVTAAGVTQLVARVPASAPGPASLVLRYEMQGAEPFTEEVPLALAPVPERRARDTISTHSLQWADDSDPQPSGAWLVARPAGRVVAGFDNEFFVRVTHPDGSPRQGPVEVVLVDGDFAGQRGDAAAPPRLLRGETDRLGLARLRGHLASDVLRLEVRVLAPGDERVLQRRRQRFVSYSGAVEVRVGQTLLAPDEATEVHARGLGGKREVLVDVFSPGGAWVETFHPPFSGAELPRAWTPPSGAPGLWQLEAYHFANAPGESAAIARLQVEGTDPRSRASLDLLLRLQRERLGTARVEKGFSAEHEGAYLDAIGRLELQPEEVETARAFLLETLPVAVYGPALALTTREREEQAVVGRRALYKQLLRWFLLGGGGVFLAIMASVAALEARRAGRALATDAGADGIPAGVLASSPRGIVLRAVGILVVMAVSLFMTILLLENLL